MLVTNKEVQTHWHCPCGMNVVDHESIRVRWRDLSKLGIKRKKDRRTGKAFFLLESWSNECHCHDDN